MMDECKVTSIRTYMYIEHCTSLQYPLLVQMSTSIHNKYAYWNTWIIRSNYKVYLIKALYTLVILFCSILILHFVQNDSESNTLMPKN
jgi:hypothetical protein